MAALVACTLAFAPVPQHTRPSQHKSIGVGRPRMMDPTEAMSLVLPAVALAGGAYFFLGNDDMDANDRTRASRLPVQPPDPAAVPPDTTLRRILDIISDTAGTTIVAGNEYFVPAWAKTVSEIGVQASAAAAPGTTLQARIDSVQKLALMRNCLADCLAARVVHDMALERLAMMPSSAAIAPATALPSDAVTLVRGLQQFPGQSARQVRGFIVESAPSDDPSVVGRFDKKQAASLYMGSVQFGYFIATIFRGQADLDPQAVLSLEEAMAIKQDIQKSTREMRSEAAWAAASRRAGTFFGLQRDHERDAVAADAMGGEAAAGYEMLREFTVGVQVVGSAQQEEFFAASSDQAPDGLVGDLAAAAAAAANGFLPAGDFVRFNAAGLQAMMAEGCVFGWHLWGAEAEARVLLESVGGDEALLAPPATPS